MAAIRSFEVMSEKLAQGDCTDSDSQVANTVRQKLAVSCGQLHSEELYNIRVTTSRVVTLAGAEEHEG